MRILNLTQHPATPDQIAAGVEDHPNRVEVTRLLTFEAQPNAAEIELRAKALADLCANPEIEAAMIGGAGYLMGALERALRAFGVIPMHAFSRRESVERVQPDGSTKKETIFRHAGFVFPPHASP